MEVKAEEPALVVIAQSFYHSWRCQIDGQPTRIWRANHGFQAVQVPPGSHHISLAYHDNTLLAGAGLSLAALLICGCVWETESPSPMTIKSPSPGVRESLDEPNSVSLLEKAQTAPAIGSSFGMETAAPAISGGESCEFYENRSRPCREQAANRYYHRLVEAYFKFFIPPGASVLEIGCGLGDLLSSLKPRYGVGIDFSATTIEQARERHPELEFRVAEALQFRSDQVFDYVVLSDLVNDLPDVQAVLSRVLDHVHSRSRVILNFFNNVWRPVLRLGEWLGCKVPTPPQSWLSAADVQNLLHLAGWELVKQDIKILWPFRTPLLAPFLNRWIAPLPVVRQLCLSVFQVARPHPVLDQEDEYSCSVIIPARNEAGNIEAAVRRIPDMGKATEILFIEGHSRDNTWEEIQRVQAAYPEKNTVFKTAEQRERRRGPRSVCGCIGRSAVHFRC